MPTLYILQGIAGAGKSTLALSMIPKIAPLMYEADMWMEDEKGNYKFDPKNLNYAHSQCRKAVEGAMIIKQNVIQSNTNLHRKDVNPYLDLAEKYGYNVVIIKLNSSYGSIHNVPPDKIASMKDLLDRFDYKNLPDFVTVEEYYPEDEAHVEYLNQQSDQDYEEFMEQ